MRRRSRLLQRSNSFESEDGDEEEEEINEGSKNEGRHQEEKREGTQEMEKEWKQEPGRIAGGIEEVDESVKKDAVRLVS